MKKKFFILSIAALTGFGAVSAQTTVSDSVDNRAREINQYANDRAQQAQNLKDSVADSKTVNQNEKAVLNKDYNNVKDDYKANNEQAKKALQNPDKINKAEARKKYNHDYKEFKGDSTAIYNQHRRFNKAVSDGVTPAERKAMEKQYKRDKRHYKDDKKKVNHQKEVIRDSPNQ